VLDLLNFPRGFNNRGAIGIESEKPKALRGEVWKGGASPPPSTRGSGGAYKAPPAGSGAEPRPKTDFGEVKP